MIVVDYLTLPSSITWLGMGYVKIVKKNYIDRTIMSRKFAAQSL